MRPVPERQPISRWYPNPSAAPPSTNNDIRQIMRFVLMPQIVEAAPDSSQARANFLSKFGERPARCVELLNGIDNPEHSDAVVPLEEDDVARQEQAGARVELHGFQRVRWIAGAEDPAATRPLPFP